MDQPQNPNIDPSTNAQDDKREAMPQTPEQLPTAPAPTESVPVPPTANPVIPDPDPESKILNQVQDDKSEATDQAPTPELADDVDVIEKEWVDKAEEVVKKTAGDPYQEEEQVEDLQLDYLKKRYGKEIDKPKPEA